MELCRFRRIDIFTGTGCGHANKSHEGFCTSLDVNLPDCPGRSGRPTRGFRCSGSCAFHLQQLVSDLGKQRDGPEDWRCEQCNANCTECRRHETARAAGKCPPSSRCSGCKRERATEITQLRDLPAVLTIRICRGLAGPGQTTHKRVCPVNIPMSLDTQSLLAGGAGRTGARYTLVGCVNHRGDTIKDGHFLTLVRDEADDGPFAASESWCVLDDSASTHGLCPSAENVAGLVEFSGSTVFAVYAMEDSRHPARQASARAASPLSIGDTSSDDEDDAAFPPPSPPGDDDGAPPHFRPFTHQGAGGSASPQSKVSPVLQLFMPRVSAHMTTGGCSHNSIPLAPGGKVDEDSNEE